MAKRSQLDTLLRIRRLEEDQAKAKLAAANLAEREAQELLDRRRATYREQNLTPAEGDPTAFLRSRATGAALGAGIVSAEQRCESTAAATEESRDAMRVARMRTQGLERLVERAAQARFQEMLAADQRTAEESRAGKKSGSRR